MKKTITRDEWQAAYEEATKGDPGETVKEIAERLGVSRRTISDWVRKLVEEGKAVRGTGKRERRPVKVYQLVKGARNDRRLPAHAGRDRRGRGVDGLGRGRRAVPARGLRGTP